MKKIFTPLIAVLLFVCTTAHAYLNTGRYELSGSKDSSGIIDYTGEMIIERQGENYRITRYLDGYQSEVGIGILKEGGLFQNDILSVAFCDLTGDVWGVISYEVLSAYELEGKWASSEAYTSGREFLTWVSY